MQNRTYVRCLSLIFALIVAIACGISALAAQEGTPTLPEPSEQFYILDEAQVLSESTVQTILTKNEELYAQYGVQIVVQTVRDLQNRDIQSYASDIYKAWEIGGADEKGLLLVLDIAGDNYFTVAGAGLRENMTSTALQAMLNQNLEPDFAAKNYDAGVVKFFNAAAQRAELFVSSQTPAPTVPAPSDSPTSDPTTMPTDTAQKETESLDSNLPQGLFIFASVLAGGVAVFAIVMFVYNRTRQGDRR